MSRAVRVLVVPAAIAAALIATPSVAAGATADGVRAPITRQLTPSTPQLARCLPTANATVSLNLTSRTRGFDMLSISATGLPRSTQFTVFLLERAGQPFGTAQYLGGFRTDATGTARNTYQVVIEHAFSSAMVNGRRTRTELNQIGVWFADPKSDDVCFGAGGGQITPFDGDNQAGVQLFNSSTTQPLP